MKKLTLAILIALVSAFAAAQGPGGMRGGPGGPGGGRMDPKARLEQMKKDLSLSPDQVKKVEVLQTKMMGEMKKLRDAPGDRNAKRPQMMKLRDEFTASLKKVLNATQFAKYEKMQKERMSRMRGGFGGPGGPGGMRGGPGGPGGPGKKGGA